MRKFFALALAVAMVLSLASVSFAATNVKTVIGNDLLITDFFKYDGDKNEIKAEVKEYGKAYYALILEGTTTEMDPDTTADDDEFITEIKYLPISEYKRVERMKVKAEFEMGEELVESVSIVKKKIDTIPATVYTALGNINMTDVDGSSATYAAVAAGDVPTGKYYYFVEIKTKKEVTTSESDIIGTLEFNRKADKDEGIFKLDDIELDFALNVFYEKTWISDEANFKVEDSVTLKWDNMYALKFENDDEVEIEFGTDPNEGCFTVDVSGQGKLIVNYSTKADEAICAANPGAKMFFVNFNNVKFNRVGTFEYEMENMVAAYQVVDGKLVEINGLELDDDTATFNTRTLGNYVFADAELVNPVVEAPVVEAPAAVTNPSTGF